MSGQHTKAVWAGSVHRGTHLTMMLAIAWRAHDNGVIDLSLNTLAEDARVTVRQAKRVIKDLVASKELSVTSGRGRNNTNVYKVTLGAQKGDTDDTISPLKGDTGVTICDVKGDIQGQEKVTPVSPDKERESNTTTSPSATESRSRADVKWEEWGKPKFLKLKAQGWSLDETSTRNLLRGKVKEGYTAEQIEDGVRRMYLALLTERSIRLSHAKFFAYLLREPEDQGVDKEWEVVTRLEPMPPVVNKPRTEEETNQPLEELQRKVARMMEASRNA